VDEHQQSTPAAASVATSPTVLVAVARDKFYPGQDGWLWTPTPGHLPPYEVVPLLDALQSEYATDAHFVGCVAYLDGKPVWRQPRLTKDGLREVRDRGFEVLHSSLVADIDTPGHAPITQEQIGEAAGRLSRLPAIGWYSSRAGLRVLQPLASSIPPEHYEAILPTWLSELGHVLGSGWVIDANCKDWTRHFRLPFVVRAGKVTKPVLNLSQMTAIEPPRAPPRPPASVPSERQRIVIRMARKGSGDRIVRRAEAYALQVATPECNTGSCDRAAFHVASVLTEGFALGQEDALGILATWAARGRHVWKPGDLARKVSDAAKAAKSVGHLLRPRGGVR
jgi:hypothetical protein